MDEVIPIIYDYENFVTPSNTESVPPEVDHGLDLVTTTIAVVENPIIPSTINFERNATTTDAVVGNATPIIRTAGTGRHTGMYTGGRGGGGGTYNPRCPSVGLSVCRPVFNTLLFLLPLSTRIQLRLMYTALFF